MEALHPEEQQLENFFKPTLDRGGNVYLYQCGFEHCESLHSFGPAVRDHYLIHCVLSGKGKAVIDGEETTLSAGDWLRVAPAARRQFFAAPDEGITYICMQVKEGSLGGFTADDAVVY